MLLFLKSFFYSDITQTDGRSVFVQEKIQMGKKHHRRRNDGNFSFWDRWPLQTAVVVTLLWFFLTWMCGDIKLVHVCWVSQKITGADKPSFIDVSDRSCLLSVEFDKRLKLLPASVNWLSDTFVLISYNFLSCMLNLYCLTTPPTTTTTSVVLSQ